MNWQNIVTIYLKELKDSLRDRRTLISMIVIPTFLMPLIIFGVGTIMTKVVTLIVVVALYVLGGPALKGFSEALIIGIVAGTYSSIYISSAIALDCGLKAEHLLPTAVKKPVDDLP